VFYLFAYDWAKSRSTQLSGASVSDDDPIATGGRALIAAMVADASALDFEMNPNPLQRKHTPFARRYPRFPVPLHFVQELEVETIVIVLDMCKQ